MFPGPVCVVLTPTKVSEIYSADLTGADCVEVRLDYLADPRESRGVNWGDFACPVIATCRSVDSGGRFAGTIVDWLDRLDRFDTEFLFAKMERSPQRAATGLFMLAVLQALEFSIQATASTGSIRRFGSR